LSPFAFAIQYRVINSEELSPEYPGSRIWDTYLCNSPSGKVPFNTLDQTEEQVEMPQLICKTAGAGCSAKNCETDEHNLCWFPPISEAPSYRCEGAIGEEVKGEHTVGTIAGPPKLIRNKGKKDRDALYARYYPQCFTQWLDANTKGI
jgi:hypothetical protein